MKTGVLIPTSQLLCYLHNCSCHAKLPTLVANTRSSSLLFFLDFTKMWKLSSQPFIATRSGSLYLISFSNKFIILRPRYCYHLRDIRLVFSQNQKTVMRLQTCYHYGSIYRAEELLIFCKCAVKHRWCRCQSASIQYSIRNQNGSVKQSIRFHISQKRKHISQN